MHLICVFFWIMEGNLHTCLAPDFCGCHPGDTSRLPGSWPAEPVLLGLLGLQQRDSSWRATTPRAQHRESGQIHHCPSVTKAYLLVLEPGLRGRTLWHMSGGPLRCPLGRKSVPESPSLQAHRAIFLYTVYVVCTYTISSFSH